MHWVLAAKPLKLVRVTIADAVEPCAIRREPGLAVTLYSGYAASGSMEKETGRVKVAPFIEPPF